jgi:hypothetical protein
MKYEKKEMMMKYIKKINQKDRQNTTGVEKEHNETVHQLFVDFKKAYDSVRRVVLYNILIEFGVPVKLFRLIQMCLNKTHSKVHIRKHLSDSVPIQNGLKQGDALLPLLFNFAVEYAIK